MGWIRADRYAVCARQALERDVFGRLAAYGIATPR
jgi:hypothetical protein